MIELSSNGRVGNPNPVFTGTDEAEIRYPDMISCISITLVCGGNLVGMHLFRGNTPQTTDADLATFAEEATASGVPNQMYVVGHFGQWTGPINFTGYQPTAASLYAELARLTGYVGGVATFDLGIGGACDLRAVLDAPHVSFSRRANDGAEWDAIGAGNFDLEVPGP